MLSPELTKFLMNYQDDKYRELKPEKEYINFKKGGGTPIRVPIYVKK